MASASRIILGGPQVSYSGPHVPGLETLYPEADAFVRGYGETALASLAETAGLPPIPGVYHASDEDRCTQLTSMRSRRHD